jgi:hypothetical protein
MIGTADGRELSELFVRRDPLKASGPRLKCDRR